MDQQNGEQPADTSTSGGETIVPPAHPDAAHHPEEPIKPEVDENHPKSKGRYAPKRRRRSFKVYGRKFKRAGADRHIELILAALVTGFVITQTVNSCNAINSNTDQTNQLITAAKINSAAAQQNALAASSFASTEEKINQDLQNAVGRLNAQAAATSDVANAAASQAQASNTIATATQQSANTAHDALYLEQRPWVGVQIAPADIPANVKAGEGIVLSAMIPIAINSGRTPALRWQQECTMMIGNPYQMPFESCDERRAETENQDMEETIARNIRLHPNLTPESIREDGEKVLKARATERELSEKNSGRTIIPNGSLKLNLNIVSSANDGKPRYSIGTFVYHDAIDPTEKHVTDYCIVFNNRSWALCDFGQNMN